MTDGASSMRQVKAILIGAGNRGVVYSNYALDFPDRLKIVAVAEPRQGKLNRVSPVLPNIG